MSIRIGVVSRRNLVLVPRRHQRCHRIGRGAVHPDLAVVIQGHEPPGGVHERVHHGQVQRPALGDRGPVIDAGPAQRVGADPDACTLDDVEIDDVDQIVHICLLKVIPLHGFQRLCQRYSLHRAPARTQNLVGARGDRPSGIGIGRATVRRVVLEPAVAGRVMRRGNDDPVGQTRGLALVVPQDGMAHCRSRGVPVTRIHSHYNTIGGQNLQCAGPRGFGERVGVSTDEQWAGGALRGPVLDDRLGGSDDVRLVEGAVETRPSVPGGPEDDLLRHVSRVGVYRVIRGHHMGDVDEVFRLGRLSGARVAHPPDSARIK